MLTKFNFSTSDTQKFQPKDQPENLKKNQENQKMKKTWKKTVFVIFFDDDDDDDESLRCSSINVFELICGVSQKDKET